MRITLIVLAALPLFAVSACHSRNPGWGTPPPVVVPPGTKPPRDICKNLAEPDKSACYAVYPGGVFPNDPPQP